MNDTITIQTGIPIPPSNGKASKPRDLMVEALKRMMKDESFFVPFTRANAITIQCARTMAKGMTGNFYVARTVTEEGQRGMRVWRVA